MLPLWESGRHLALLNLRELVFSVTSEVNSWIPGAHELLRRAPPLETAMLLNWRGPYQNLDHIILIPDISSLRSLSVFVPLACMDRYDVRRTMVPKNTKVNAADMVKSALDWTRRMLFSLSRRALIDD